MLEHCKFFHDENVNELQSSSYENANRRKRTKISFFFLNIFYHSVFQMKN